MARQLDDRCLFHCLLRADLSELSDMRRQLTLFFNHLSLADKEIGQLLLGASEVCSNIIRHSQPAATFIQLNVLQRSEKHLLVIEHDGQAFDQFNQEIQNLASDTMVSPFDSSQLLESGMGLKLIAMLFPQSFYQSGQLVHRFVFPLSHQAHAKKMRVLLIDDEPVQLQVLTQYLNENYHVEAFDLAGDALVYLKQHSVDLILSDITMQAMDGFEFREQILAMDSMKVQDRAGNWVKQQAKAIPFVYISAREHVADLSRAATLGVNDYLYKPLCKAQLLAVVQRVLKNNAHIKQALGAQIDSAITQSLQMQLPENLGSLNVTVRSRNAQRGGGDFVYHHHDDKRDLLILADVMGHDETAKFFAHAYAAYMRGTVCALSHLPSPEALSPSELLTLFSKTLQDDDFLNQSLLTCLILSINGVECTVAAAAHPAPILLQQDQLQVIEIDGALLALPQTMAYSQRVFSLENNTRLLIFTDGFIEGFCSPTAYVESQAHATLMQCSKAGWQLPLDLFADHLMAAFDKRNAMNAPDDASFILLELN
ncbi:MAG: response regulator [Pseudomonadales bacterium]|nr:response regulator [Pseudomonadales bacterium]